MDKAEKYREVLIRSAQIYSPEMHPYAAISQMLAFIKHEMQFFWVGIYIKKGNQLVLGPFQGQIACTLISEGKGACGKAAAEHKAVVIDDVSSFPGYIACHPETASEIVIPALNSSQCLFVLDVDSNEPAYFDETDVKYLTIFTESLKKIYLAKNS